MNNHLLFKCTYPDANWICIDADILDFIGISLVEYFDIRGIDIPDYIHYCLIDKDSWKIKFREYGGAINIYESRKSNLK